jgi:hypothetical protein
MTVGEIIQAVRWCYDEEQMDSADFGNTSANDNTYMDNIIKSKIGDAVRWICLYSPAELLGGSDEVDGTTPIQTGILVDATPIAPTAITGTNGGYINLPTDFIKLARVRVTGWHRAVKTPLSEDSDEYLQLRDDSGATATADRPQAAIIDKAAKQLEVWPTGTTADYTYVADIDNAIKERTVGTETEEYVALPPRIKTAFIYYLAFLVLSAYEDSRAPRMLEIAKMNIGKNG